MTDLAKLEQRIRHLELTVIAQKSSIQTLHGALFGYIYSDDPGFVNTFSDQFNILLASFIRANFNKAKVSPEDYDCFINSAKKDFTFPSDISAN